MGFVQLLARSMFISFVGSEIKAVHALHLATARFKRDPSSAWSLFAEVFWGLLMVYFLLSIVSMVMFVHVEFGIRAVLAKYLGR